MIKRSLFIASATVFVASVANIGNAQLFRACPNGACYSARARVVQRYHAAYTPNVAAPCEAVQKVEPCEPVSETSEPCEPCEPCEPVAEVVEPCAPVQACAPVATCEQGEYIPTERGNICVNGTCPIRTAVKTTAKVAHTAVRTTVNTAKWLLAVNRTRAAYGLAPLKADATLDAGCADAVDHCAAVGWLDHTAGNEILAYNSTGIDAAIGSWLNSPAHKAYLLSSSFTAAGVYVTRDKYGRVWCAMRFR